MAYVKQYGLMRSGTCYTRAFIEANFRNVSVVENILGWKHGPHRPETDLKGKSWLGTWNKPNTYAVKMYGKRTVRRIIKAYEAGEMAYVVTIRNPYIWCVSAARYKGQRLTAPYVRSHMKHWSEQHRQWLRDIPTDSRMLVLYEALRDNPDGRKIAIEMFLGLKPKRGLHVPKLYVSPGVEHGRRFKQRHDYMKEYTPGMLKVANSVLDKGLMEYLGYEIVRKPVPHKR